LSGLSFAGSPEFILRGGEAAMDSDGGSHDDYFTGTVEWLSPHNFFG